MVDKPKTGSIIYIDFDPSKGKEIQKKRPAVVVSNHILAMTSPFIWAVPISHGSFNGKQYPMHIKLDERTETDGTVYAEQLRMFDYTSRSWKTVEMLPTDKFNEIQMILQATLR
ncbi:hypothetical protein JC2156_00250 [Weissella koreensis KCTC 3621]|uniref:type II toxin-antitoxin system PemK/MazF family toxin n=1 Tax=Weissella koreensis TaxID=165096 RepID=UPI00021756E1|nr:type II toxin-antitoxin system PemK/MazF family toxin [Weissella koreensis]AEJ22902.1 transcriptional regulator [Weissella koreensis KACC 15510]EJF34143.1 hypothetical protein JC2156_00250 [Weissella koreensis KCTC 3621]